MTKDNTTVIICCAGMGTRLGIGTPKALLKVKDESLIIQLLECFDDYSDVRVVVGFQANKIIKKIKQYRKDVMFVFNYNYEINGPAASFSKALIGAKENIITIDGDVFVSKEQIKKLLNFPNECIAVTKFHSTEGIYGIVKNNNFIEFTHGKQDYQWPSIAKLKRNKLIPREDYIYKMIENLLPLPMIEIEAYEINTQDDYEKLINI